jgi:hypothetical protein
MPTDPFTGTWTLNFHKSSFTFPAPRSWVQHIQCSEQGISLNEEVATSDGDEMNISLEAEFNDGEYPVSGSGLVDAIAYRRPDSRTISAAGKQNGAVSMRQTCVVAEDGKSYMMSLSLFSNNHQTGSATLVFERQAGE